MIEIGEKPILWHIMKLYSSYGFNDFIICLGYKSQVIKEYFSNYLLFNSDVTFDFQKENECIIHNHFAEPWKVTLVETGINTLTGGRVKRVQKYVGSEPFMLTYGDGVSDINIKELVEFHQAHGKLATVTATQPIGRFGVLSLSSDQKVEKFQEKYKAMADGSMQAFLFYSPTYLTTCKMGDQTVFEMGPLEKLAKDGQLMAYKHTGFWHPMDTLRDKKYLEEIWTSGKAPWRKENKI